MEQIAEQDLVRLKELLRRTGEFIAYFELAETKMIEWRQTLEQQTTIQQTQFQQQFDTIRSQLESLQEILTEAGLARFRIAANTALNQGKEYLDSMQKTEQHFLKLVANCQRDLNQMSTSALEQITDHTQVSMQKLDNHLSNYDVQHFHRIANESCEQVEKSAQQVITTSGKILRLFQWRAVALAFLTTVITALAVGLYMNDEYPWEIHQHAMNERGAGKMLMNAWPKLTYQEKIKILGEQSKHS